MKRIISLFLSCMMLISLSANSNVAYAENKKVNINNVSYYSSFEAAVSDCNALSNINADPSLNDEFSSVAGVSIYGDKAMLYLYKSIDSVANITLLNNTAFDLCNATLTFKSGCYLTYNKDLDIKNGSIIVSDSKGAIVSSNSNLGILNIDNLKIDANLTSNNKSDCVLVDSYSLTNNINNCKATIKGNPTSGAIYTYRTQNRNSVNNFTEIYSTIDITSYNSTAKSIVNYCKSTDITNVFIYVRLNGSTGGTTGGIYYGGDTNITGALISVETVNATKGYGVGRENLDAKLTIKENATHPVEIYGKIWGVTSGRGMLTIDGGKYSSTDHSLYVGGSGKISNAKIFIDRYDQYSYSSLSTPYGIYCGGPNGNNKPYNNNVVDFYNCELNNGAKKATNGVVATWNYVNNGYIGPSQINFYDCDIYSGSNSLFCFNTQTNDLNYISNTKFNLYNSTKLYDVEGNLISKSTLDNSINNWKGNITKPSQSNSTLRCGDFIICGNGYYNIDDDSFICYCKPESNVYDNRAHDYVLKTQVLSTPNTRGYKLYECNNCLDNYKQELPYATDKKVLNSIIDSCSVYNADDFIHSSYDAYKIAYDACNSALKEDISQIQIDSLITNLIDKIYLLEPYFKINIDSNNGTIESYINNTLSKETVAVSGAKIELKAIPNSNYKFVGWYEKTTKRFLSYDNIFSFNITTNMDIKALFIKTDDSVLMFDNGTGYIENYIVKSISEWASISNLDSIEPFVPYRYGSINGRWEYDFDTVKNSLVSGKTTTVYACYDKLSIVMPNLPVASDNKPVLKLDYSYNQSQNVGSFIMGSALPDGFSINSMGLAFYLDKSELFDPQNYYLTLSNKSIVSQFYGFKDNYHIVNLLNMRDNYNYSCVGYITYYNNKKLITIYSNQINLIGTTQTKA